MIGCTIQPDQLGIPRTQAERAGSGPGACRPRSRAAARPTQAPRRPSTMINLHRRPTPPPPLPHPAMRSGPMSPGRAAVGPGPGGNRPRAWPLVRPGWCHPDGSLSASARAGTGLRHRTRLLLTRPGPVPHARTRRFWAGRANSTVAHVGTYTGRRASPARPGPWGSTGLLTVCWIAGVVLPLPPRRWSPRIAQRGALPG
jgi:hypothetical protein